jgi:hypothetical protein
VLVSERIRKPNTFRRKYKKQKKKEDEDIMIRTRRTMEETGRR